MTSTKNPLLKAIDIATTSMAILRHVQGIALSEPMAAQEEFCGSSLLRAQIGIQPMLLALSMELALKAWIVYENTKKDVPRSHDLWKLFSYTSAATQEQLKKRYEREIAPGHPNIFSTDYGLEHVLENACGAFVQWRYSFELETARFDTGLFTETVEMILSEFESRIVVVKQPPPFSCL